MRQAGGAVAGLEQGRRLALAAEPLGDFPGFLEGPGFRGGKRRRGNGCGHRAQAMDGGCLGQSGRSHIVPGMIDRGGVPGPRILLPEAPSVVAGFGRAAIVTRDGEVAEATAADAAGAAADAAAACSGACAGDAAPARAPGAAVLRPAGAVRLRAAGASGGADAAGAGAGARPAPCPHRGWRGPRGCWRISPTTLLARLAAGRELPINREAAALAWRMGRAGWPWAEVVLAALGGEPGLAAGADALRVWRRLPEWEEVAPLPPPSSHPVLAAEARRRLAAMLGPDAEQRPGPVRLRRRRRRGVRPARHPGRSAARAGRGRHRHRQDARLHRAGQPVGGAQQGAGVDLHLHPPSAAPGGGGTGAAASRPRRAPPPRGGAQGARELPLPAELRGRGGGRRRQRPGLGGAARADRALGAGDCRRRHPGRRPARLVRRTVRHRHGRRARRPSRRVHPRGLPALAALFRRAHHPPRADRRAGGGEPCAGDGAGGLGRHRRQHACRCATCSTRAITCSTPPTARSRPSFRASRRPSCGAGCWAPRAAARGPAGCAGASRSWWRTRPELETPLEAALQAARGAAAAGLVGAAARGGAGTRRGRAGPAPIPPRRSCAPPAARCWRAPRAGRSPASTDSDECDLFPPGPDMAEAAATLARALWAGSPPRSGRWPTGWQRGWTTRPRNSTPPCATASRRPAARSAAARSTGWPPWQEMLGTVAAGAPQAEPGDAARAGDVPPPRPPRRAGGGCRAAPALARPDGAVRR